MVILYNRNGLKNITPLKKINVKKYKKSKHFKSKFSKKSSSQRITLNNKNFLKSLGLKVLV